jgi:3-deoxy-7-phosphoheptulonate synthase
LLPRIYTNKPRTRGEGYKGMLHNPDPKKGTDMQAGITALRRMHLRVIKESGLTGADEMLYPDNYSYLDDVLSYVAVGARSVENQQHRLVASGIDVAVGMKNPTNGSFPALLNSIYAAQIANEFKYNDYHVRTNGNPYAHAVLRGRVDIFGHNLQNYHFEDIIKFYRLYKEESLKNSAVIIDANHSNSGKQFIEQIRIVEEVVTNMTRNADVNEIVKGFMIESYLIDGNQPADGKEYGKSITDACLGWEKTEKLILNIADKL